MAGRGVLLSCSAGGQELLASYPPPPVLALLLQAAATSSAGAAGTWPTVAGSLVAPSRRAGARSHPHPPSLTSPLLDVDVRQWPRRRPMSLSPDVAAPQLDLAGAIGSIWWTLFF